MARPRRHNSVPSFGAWIRAGVLGLTLGIPIVSVMLVEGALHPRGAAVAPSRQPEWLPPGAAWQSAHIRAADGVALDAWLLTPAHPNGAVVTLLHGVGDTRSGMLGYAHFLLRAGYAALLPDARGHGASGGDSIGYGVLEGDDLRRWSDWLCAQHPQWRQYGLGVSLGAAILLESLVKPVRFRAVVAESPFATFREIAYDRLSIGTGLPAWAFGPVVQLGIFYTRARYGLDLRRASPADAVRDTSIPILLIHGSADRNVPLHHSLELQSVNPRAVRLWVIPRAAHVHCLEMAGREYERRVLDWFQKD